MFASILFPETLTPEKLDTFLANGWFRMGQSIFTTHFLHFSHCFYSAIWLRVGLENVPADAKFKQLQKQNSRFRIEILKAEITPQHEALYAAYRKSISFEPSETLQTLMFGYANTNRFNTYQVNIFDGSKLIAAGFFDMGKGSAAGIVSFYHPDYKKHSLGKYLIYLKMAHAAKSGLQYFYPGYVAPGYPPFDYKLAIGKSTLQYYAVDTRNWLPYTYFSPEADPLERMHNKLNVLQGLLHNKHISSKILYYQFFDANLDPYYATDKLLDYPVFIYCNPLNETDPFRLIVYDILNENYCLVKCSAVLKTDWFKSVDQAFSSHLLKTDSVLLSKKNAAEFIGALM